MFTSNIRIIEKCDKKTCEFDHGVVDGGHRIAETWQFNIGKTLSTDFSRRLSVWLSLCPEYLQILCLRGCKPVLNLMCSSFCGAWTHMIRCNNYGGKIKSALTGLSQSDNQWQSCPLIDCFSFMSEHSTSCYVTDTGKREQEPEQNRSFSLLYFWTKLICKYYFVQILQLQLCCPIKVQITQRYIRQNHELFWLNKTITSFLFTVLNLKETQYEPSMRKLVFRNHWKWKVYTCNIGAFL